MAGAVGKPLEPGTAARIFTGAPIPPGADAVVMQEHTSAEGDSVLLKKAPKPGDWIRYVGSDVRKGGEILPAGKRLLPQDTGPRRLGRHQDAAGASERCAWACSLPATSWSCRASRWRRAASTTPTASRCAGWARLFGCEVRDYGIVPDSLEATREVLRRAADECDVIVTSGGVSVGEADYVKPAVEAEGKLLMWRIAMKPGRPLAFGTVAEGVFHRPAGQPGVELRHLPDLRAARSCCAPRAST